MYNDESIFILAHKDLYMNEYPGVKILQCGSSGSDESISAIKDNTGDNISDMNLFFLENTGIYWIWKNTGGKYKVQTQYRRVLSGICEYDLDDIFSDFDVITAKPLNLIDKYGDNMTVERQYGLAHNINDIFLIEDIIASDYNEYYEDYCKYIKNGNMLIYSNGFIMRSSDYDNYCGFLFGVLEKWLNIRGIANMDDVNEYVLWCDKTNQISRETMKYKDDDSMLFYQCRIGGSLSERLLTLYVLHNFKRIKYVDYVKKGVAL